MKILQLVPYFYPAWSFGGPAKLVYDTSLQFAKLGHQVIVLTSDAYTATERMPKELQKSIHKNCRVLYEQNYSPMFAHGKRIFFRISTLFRIPSLVQNTDLIHLHDFFTVAHIGVFFWALILRKPYIVSVHGTLESQSILQKSLIKKVYMISVGKFFLQHASFVIATSDSEYNSLQKFGVLKQKLIRIGHGVNAAEFHTKLTKKEARLKLQLPAQETVVTFLGRIHKLKGMDLLEKVILQSNLNLHFVIAGSDDGYLSQLKKSLAQQSNVTFLGPQFGAEKSQLFAATSIFLYPSHSEGFSLGILEALSVGLPTIITKGCHFEELGEAQAGLVVPTTVPGLIKGIRSLAANPKQQAFFSRNAKLYIQKKYSFEVITRQLLAVYEKSLN